MIKFEVGDPELRKSLGRMLGQKGGVPAHKTVSIIEMDPAEAKKRRRESFEHGIKRSVLGVYENYLAELIERASSGERLVIIGSERKADLAESSAWQGLMGYPNVSYCEMLDATTQLPLCVKEVIDLSRPENEIAIELANITSPQGLVRGLRHAVYGDNAKWGVTDEWRQQAKAVFGDLSDEELIRKAQDAEPEAAVSLFEGRKLDAAFFDIEGTLLNPDGTVNENVAAELESAAKKKPVIIWTDGDLGTAEALRKAGIFSPVRPKSVFAGSEVAQAWDDRDEAYLQQEFRVTVDEFHQVSDLREGDIMREGPGSSGGPEVR